MSTARSSWGDYATAFWSRWGGIAAVGVFAAAFAYGPLVAPFFANLWAREYYQHFPFVLAAFVGLLGQRLAGATPRPRDFERGQLYVLAGMMMIAGAWGLLAIGYRINSLWFAYVSLIALIGGALLWASSRLRIEGAAGVWLLLWLIVPLPLQRDQALVTWLQRFSSKASSFVLDFVGVPHLMEGNTLALPQTQLFVDEACSGIISVTSLVACAAIYGVWRRRSAVHVVALIAAGIAWATVMNTVRISAIAIALDKWGIDWSKGTPHEVLSLTVFLLAFLALVSTDVLLEGLLAPIGEAWERQRGGDVSWGARLVHAWDASFSPDEAEATSDQMAAGGADRPNAEGLRPPSPVRWTLLATALIAFAALPVWAFARGGQELPLAEAVKSDQAQACIARATAIGTAFLPEKVGALERLRYFAVERERDDLLGNFSRCHEYQDAKGRTYLVSCDFPYEGGWHELTLCYLGVGWTLDERRVAGDKSGDAGAAPAAWERMDADFSKFSGARAFVTVCAFDEFGEPLAIPTQSLWADAWNALTQQRTTRANQVAFQTQVFTTSADPIDDEQRAAARMLMLAARERFHELVGAGASKSGDRVDNAKKQAGVASVRGAAPLRSPSHEGEGAGQD